MIKYYEKKRVSWLEDFDGKTLAQMKHEINALTDMYGSEAVLKVEYDWDSVDTYIETVRGETEAEKAIRIEKETKQERADRTRYEKLKAKYGWE